MNPELAPDAITTDELAELLVRIRSECDIPGRRAAERIGMEPQLLAAWERGERLTKIACFLALLTEVYGFTVKFVPPRQTPSAAPVEVRTQFRHRVISRAPGR